jgi:hypothetical protein
MVSIRLLPLKRHSPHTTAPPLHLPPDSELALVALATLKWGGERISGASVASVFRFFGEPVFRRADWLTFRFCSFHFAAHGSWTSMYSKPTDN